MVKASAGAAHHLSIYKVTNLAAPLQDLKQAGYWTVGLAVGAKRTIYDRDYPDKLAIVLGSEGAGVRPINLRECDFLVSIPMLGKVASLNVGGRWRRFFYMNWCGSSRVDKVVTMLITLHLSETAPVH